MDLRPAGLNEHGMESALGSLIEQFCSRHNLNVRVKKNDLPILLLAPNLELALRRIPQDALFSIARHANTEEATLLLRRETVTIYLAIEDKRTGIKALESAKRSGNHGMTIM